MSKDYYKILGVDKNASKEDIKKAFKKASLKYHPDRLVNKSEKEKEEGEAKFKEINEAYAVLSDPDKKQRYDTFGDADFKGNFGGFGDFGFDDVFDMFTGRRNRRNGRTVVPGEDIQMQIPLTLKEIYCGCTKTVKYTIKTRCPNCHGEGGVTKICPHCGGTGVHVVTRQFGPNSYTQTQEPCTHCNGRGKIVENKCQSCNGEGFHKKEIKLEINFRKGIQHGEAVQFVGMGNEARNPEHPNGKFIAIAVYNYDATRFTIKGIDIIEHVKIPYYKALLGDAITVTLPDDRSYRVKINECTKNGTMKRISGVGLEYTNEQFYGYKKNGDYYVELCYDIPDKLTDVEKKLLTEISESFEENEE